MSIFNSSLLPQSLVLAGSLSLYSGLAQAQTPTPPASGSAAPTAEIPQGRAGTATLCIEKRSYVDVSTKQIVTPMIYFDKIPDEGINTGYVEGNAVANAWNDFINPKDLKKKEWMGQTDIPTQFQDGVDVLKRLDKDKDGVVSKDEFEKGQKAHSEDDKKIDLGLLAALACSGKYLTEGALNTVDVQKFPEVIQLNSDLNGARTEIATLKETHAAELDAERTKFKNYAIGAGALGVLLLAGIGIAYTRGKKSAAGAPPAPKKDDKPKTEAKVDPKAAVKTDAPKAAAPKAAQTAPAKKAEATAPVATPVVEAPAETADTQPQNAAVTTGDEAYADVLANLEIEAKPADGVLAALGEADDLPGAPEATENTDQKDQNTQPTAGKKLPPPLPQQA